MASTRGSFAIGVELEMYLSPKDSDRMKDICKAADLDWSEPLSAGKHRTKLLEVLQKVLLSRHIPVVLEGQNCYTDWLVESDGSLCSGEGDGYWGAEAVSPVMYAHTDWDKKVIELFDVMNSVFDIKTNDKCGTHVHISPAVVPGLCWTTTELRSILKAICVFNDSVVDMLPVDRKKCGFTVPNFSNEHSPRAVRSLYVTARDTGDYSPVFAVINGLQTPGAFAELFENRWWSFNFSNISDSGASCGTIEFRSPPGSSDAKTATHWAVWTMSFVAAALQTDWNSPSPDGWTRAGAVAGLRQFILQGFTCLPASSRNGLDVSRLRKMTGDVAAAMTAEEIEEIKALKEKKLLRFRGL